MYQSSDESSSDDQRELLKSSKTIPKDQRLWDSFQDPPIPQTGGSAVGTKRFKQFKQIFKLIVYIVTFAIILFCGVLSKSAIMLMVAHIRSENKVRYCYLRNPSLNYYATIPKAQSIAWIWALIFAFAIPEIGALIRAGRICFFKNLRKPTWTERGIVCLFETLHVVGLGILIFRILPNLDVLKGIMLTNSICLVPAILGTICRSNFEKRTLFMYILDTFAICAQLTGLIIWPLLVQKTELWLIPLSVILVSFRWWENYISPTNPIGFLGQISSLKERLAESRYRIYMFVSTWKIILFTLLGILLTDFDFLKYFTLFLEGWEEHTILAEEVVDVFNENEQIISKVSIQSSNMFIVWTLVIQVVSSWLLYVTVKFTCKIQIQPFSFALPINLINLVSVVVLTSMCALREENACAYHGMFPDYIFYSMPSINPALDFIQKEHPWVWLLWIFSQAWITKHLWKPKNDRNASTEKLFVAPMYSGLVTDQCVAMNRQREDREKIIKKSTEEEEDPETKATNIIDRKAQLNSKMDIQPGDKIPQVYICATMWHETPDEMMEFLKSILRLDEDQCARRMAKKYIDKASDDDVDSEYYELESHIFFDDAFVNDPNKVEPGTSPVNDYAKDLICNIETAARDVYKTNMRIAPPIKMITPYGGRLIWTLPGRTKMIAHLKDKNKIRHKKRWSQVMYMYYLLGYRIMQMNASSDRKMVIAQNTYILALDGDIDFQPEAVQILIGRMKVDPDLGAACGRIHPVGEGPMVWYQVFEYAIGHWLQKATEHVIGCVLCSPGCFSLFRGRALMENSVMKKYTTTSTKARHYVQYDQGEDRWLCTLLLKQKFRVEYSAASDAYTHAPEGFNEFYNQRRRWVPSTMCNILDLLADAKQIVQKNNSISMPYICYQGMLMVGTILGPGTIFLMMVGALVSVFSISIWTSFLWNFIPLLVFMLICYFCKQKYQLIAAFSISSVYALVMMAVMIGIIMQVMDDGILSPSSLFFFIVAGQIFITGLMHPQEVTSLIFGIVYYITIPSMYMLLNIYSLFNLNDVSWGTRENPPTQADIQKKVETKKEQGRMEKILNLLRTDKEEEGSLDCSVAGIFRCMMCTHPKSNSEKMQLVQLSDQINELDNKFQKLEMRLSGEVGAMQDTDEEILDLNDEETPLQEEEVPVPNKAPIYLPDWIYDETLKNAQTETIPMKEKEFWKDLIGTYLKPIDRNEESEKKMKSDLMELRDLSVFAFVMMNSLFVLVVFLLQVQKEMLHIQWPFNARNFITYDPSTKEITIEREYLELEPIGLLFVLFFGLILFIQFVAMIVHRFGTISQILATTQLTFCRNNDYETVDAQLKGASVDLAKILQKPKAQWDESNMTEEEEKVCRRGTIHSILYQHRNLHDYSNLEKNFKQRYLKEGNLDINLKNISVTRKTLNILDTRRKTMIEERKLRKSQLINLKAPPPPVGYPNGGSWVQRNVQNEYSIDLNQYPNYVVDGIDNRAFEPSNLDSDFSMDKQQQRQSKVTFA